MANRASKSSGRIRSTDSRPWGKHKPLLTSCIDDRKWIAACRSRATRLSAPSRASYPPPHALAGRVVAPLPNIPFPQPRSVLPPLRALAPPVRPVPGRAAAGCSRLRCGPTRRAGRPADPQRPIQVKLPWPAALVRACPCHADSTSTIHENSPLEAGCHAGAVRVSSSRLANGIEEI